MKKKLLLSLLTFALSGALYAEPRSVNLKEDEVAELLDSREPYAFFGAEVSTLASDLLAIEKQASRGKKNDEFSQLCARIREGKSTARVEQIKAALHQAVDRLNSVKLPAPAKEKIKKSLATYDEAFRAGEYNLAVEISQDDAAAQDRKHCTVETLNKLIVCTLDVRCNARVAGTLSVGGNTNIGGDVNIGDCLNGTGNVTIGNDLTVCGNEVIGDCVAGTGDLTVGNDLTVCGDAVIGNCDLGTGDLTVGGALNVCAGPITLGGFPISSLIPFASGSEVSDFEDPILMGFGEDNTDSGTKARRTQYAFSVPHAGILHDLTGSVDIEFAGAILGAPVVVTFELLRSACDNGSAGNNYPDTLLVATGTLPAGSYDGTFSICVANNADVADVLAGDRVVLRVTVTGAGSDFNDFGISGGVLYTQTV